MNNSARRGGSSLSSQRFGTPGAVDRWITRWSDQQGQYGETPSVSSQKTKN